MEIFTGSKTNTFMTIALAIAVAWSATAFWFAVNAKTIARANTCRVSNGMITAVSKGQKNTLPAKACVNGQIVTNQCGRNKSVIQKTKACPNGCESVRLKNKRLVVRCKPTNKTPPSVTPTITPTITPTFTPPPASPIGGPAPTTLPAPTPMSSDTLVYSHGACPKFTEGENSFRSGTRTRKFVLRLPPRPTGAPVMFVWHGWGGTPQSAMDTAGINFYQRENFILVSPFAAGHPNPEAQYEWFFTSNPNNNPPNAAILHTT